MDIEIKDVEHRYQMKTPFERLAIYDVNAVIKEGSYVAVIGHTGAFSSAFSRLMPKLIGPNEMSFKIVSSNS